MEFNCPKRVRSPSPPSWKEEAKAEMKREIDFILGNLSENLKEFERLLEPDSIKRYNPIVLITTYNCKKPNEFMSEKLRPESYFCTIDQWYSVIMPKLREQGFHVAEPPNCFIIS